MTTFRNIENSKLGLKLILTYFASFALFALAYVLYAPFGIILPVIGSFFVQIVWFLIFFSIATTHLFRSNLNITTKILALVAMLIVAIPVQFINLFGAVFMQQLPSSVSKCSDFPIYSKPYLSGDGPMQVSLYKSQIPFLYYQPYNPISRSNFGNEANFEVKKSDFKSDSEFDKFKSCIDFKLNSTLICKDFYYTTNFSDSQLDDKKKSCNG